MGKKLILGTLALVVLCAGTAAARAVSPNDDFADATLLVAPEATHPGDVSFGTAEPDEPEHAGFTANGSLWYRFTAATNGTVVFDTCASTPPTWVAAYTGSAVNALTPVADGDTCPATTRARRLAPVGGGRVEFATTAGTTYSFAVDGLSGGGEFTAHFLFTPAATPDTTAPETSILKGPKKKSKKRPATFEFSANETATFECSLNGKPFAVCTSPSSAKAKKGKNTFEVRATDSAGNLDATPASYKWKVKKKKRKRR